MNESVYILSSFGRRIKDLTGMRFGKLVALKYSHSHNKSAFWVFQCDCGKETTTKSKYAITGDTKSCGCAHATNKSITGINAKKTPGYTTWLGMIKRCHNPDDKDYPRYGGRGISVCDSWRKSFANFHTDMGDRPEGLTLDRKDNSKGYSKDNCRWVTGKQNSRNRRSNILVTIGGETRCVTEWLEHFGTPASRYVYRVRHGWSRELAITTPKIILAAG